MRVAVFFQIEREQNEANKLAMEKEMSKVVAACEERLAAMKAEHSLQIQQRKFGGDTTLSLMTFSITTLSKKGLFTHSA